MAEPVLDVGGVWKHYGRFAALRGVDLTVGRGELFGLLGPNGAGKTTLMSLLAGLTDPTEGDVRLFGKPFSTASRNRRHLIGIATQDLAIYPELTGRENLTFFGQLYGLGRRELADRVAELLAAVGLTDRADHRAGTFSGGMKRRLNLAAAVVHEPRVLLLDEPTTGVDPQSRNHIFDQVRALNRAGMTVVYTSHYMEEVQALCPRLAILDDGKVVACDTLPHLLARLDGVARLRMPMVPSDLAGRLAKLPGVRGVKPGRGGLDVTAGELGPLLPKLVAEATAAGAELTAVDLDQPTLERVFLTLTGRELRD